MWNLFPAVEPKVIRPARSMKQQLLNQEAERLEQIHDETKSISNLINSILKQTSINSSDNQQKYSASPLWQELQDSLSSLEISLMNENIRFQDSISKRDDYKIQHQQFFKTTMKSYELKKSQLNKYIKDLQEKVQKLQTLGFKTYSLNPDPDFVLNGLNQRIINKYLHKLSTLNDIKQKISQISYQLKNHHQNNHNKSLSLRQLCNQNEEKNINQFETLEILQKQLEMILLNQEVTGFMLNDKLKKCEVQFKQLAVKQKQLKLGLRMLQPISRIKNDIKNTIEKQQNIKQAIKEQRKSQSNPNKHTKPLQNSLNEDIFDNQNQQSKDNSIENVSLHLDDMKQEQKDDEAIPSINFLQACQDLITKTFLQEQNK